MHTGGVDLGQGRRPSSRAAGGYSIVELLVAVVVAAIISLGLYSYYNSERRSSLAQRISQDLQNECNFAMEKIKGDLLLAGYRSRDAAKPITLATPSSIRFDFWDDRASTDPPFDTTDFSPSTQITYNVVGGELQRLVQRYSSASPAGFKPATPYTEVLAKNIQGLNFSYLASNNATWTPSITAGQLDNGDDIRTINFSLRCRSAKADPLYKAAGTTPRYPEITLTTQVRARNIGISEAAQDTEPPGVPENVVSWDPGECGKLELAWDARTESDLAGYTLFYGLASNSYSNRVRISAGPKGSGDRETYTLRGLDSTTSVCGVGTPSQVQYYFRVSAFDKSGNPSALSNEAFGNPGGGSVSTRTYDDIATGPATGIDSTIHPTAPAAPVLTDATPPATYNKVVLSWTKPAVEGLKGYRLYRSYTPGFTPSGRRVTDPGNNLVRDDTFLTKDVLTYTDEGLEGCRSVYYQIAAVACDECLTPQTYSPELAAFPQDNTPPPAPVLGARNGYLRIILNVENPQRATTPDFVRTKIWFREGTSYPTLSPVDPTVSNDGTLIPDSAGTPKPPRGIFTDDGTIAINFDSETVENPGPPSLKPNTDYSFLAVSYDRCGLHSDPMDASARATGSQCGDEPIGPPDATSGIDAEGCLDPVTLTWTPINPVAHGDFYGYHIFRCDRSIPGNTCTLPCVQTTMGNPPFPGWVEQTGAYIWDAKYDDTASKGLLPGGSFVYCIQTTDCYYEEHRLTWGTAAEPIPPPPAIPNDPKDNFREAIIAVPVAVGQVELDTTRTAVLTGVTASDTNLPPTPSFLHNTVLFWTRNTAASDLSLKQLSLSWENPLAYLQKVVIDNAATPDWEDTSATPAPGLSKVSGSSVSLGASSKILNLATAVPFDLTFKNQTGTVTRDTNMRQNQMDFILTYRNDSTGTEPCSSPRTAFYAPLGPYLYGTSQNLPLAGTLSWAVPGDNGTNSRDAVAVPGLTGVTVYTNVYDSSLKGIDSVILFYYVDTGKSLTAAPPTSGTYPDFSADGYVSIDMVPVVGQQWRTPALQSDGTTFGGIPQNDNTNVWFFIVAVDNEGNFDREPEPRSGAFQYYQQQGNVCENTPNPPHVLTSGDPLIPSGGSASSFGAGGVTIRWLPPTTNAVTGTPLTDLAGYYVYRSGTTTPIVTLPLATLANPALPEFSETPPNYTTETYTYTVKAYDECTVPGPKESNASNPFTECQGAAGCNITLATTQALPGIFQAGDSFKIELFACGLIDSKVSTVPGGGASIYVQTCSAGVTDADVIVMDEVGGDTGTFKIRAPVASPAQPLEQILTHDCPSGLCSFTNETDLAVRPTDTITVKGWFDNTTKPGTDFGNCAATALCSASIAVQTYSDPCATRPGTPGNLTATEVAVGDCNSAKKATLSWSAPSTGTASYYNIYFCSGSGCTLTQTQRTSGSELTFEYDVSANLKGDLYYFAVSAVNDSCAAPNANRESLPTGAVVDPCP